QEVRAGVRDLIATNAADRPRTKVASTSGMLEVYGRQARNFLQEATTVDVRAIEPGEARRAEIRDPDGRPIAEATILRRPADAYRRDHFVVAVAPDQIEPVRDWLRALSDGYVE